MQTISMTTIPKEVLAVVSNLRPRAVHEIIGKGEANRVFDISFDNYSVIVKMHISPRTALTYKKEAWCLKEAAKLGILSPQALGFGEIQENDANIFRSFLVLEKIEGMHGADSSPGEQLNIWSALGQYARKIHSIKTQGFGFDIVDDKQGRFATSTWKEEVRNLLDSYTNNESLTNGSVMSREHFEHLIRYLSQLEEWEFNPALAHANLVPKNTVITSRGNIYLLDWGTASSCCAKLCEFAEVFAWDFPDENIRLFSEGYGCTASALAQIREEAKPLMVLRLLDTVGWAANEVQGWKEKDFVKHSVKKLMSC